MQVQLFKEVENTAVVPWQDDSSNIKQLVESKVSWYQKNGKALWEGWYRDIFNLDTANQFGVTIWSIIAGMVTVKGESTLGVPSFGFAPYGANFNHGNFTFSPALDTTLTLEEQRQLVKWRFASFFYDGSLEYLNNAITAIMGSGYCVDYPLQRRVELSLPLAGASDYLKKLYSSGAIIPVAAGIKADFNWI